MAAPSLTQRKQDLLAARERGDDPRSTVDAQEDAAMKAITPGDLRQRIEDGAKVFKSLGRG